MYNIHDIKPKYSIHQLKSFNDENNFLEAAVELLKQTIELLWIIVGLKYCEKDEYQNPITITKDDAVVAGNLIRLIKLNTSFLQNVCECRTEICLILSRCIAETQINIKYMLIESEERVRRNYIKYSLITEKDLWNTISAHISDRGGDVLPIEKRMKASIKLSFDDSDFDLEEVNRSSRWKSVASRAEAVAHSQFYNIFYGITSHSVHGNWQDILMNNLSKTEDGFKLEFEWTMPKSQLMDGPIFLNLELVKLFVDKELSADSNNEILNIKCDLLEDYFGDLTISHEEFLKKNDR